MARKRRLVRIQGNVRWDIQPAEGGCYVGVCDELGLTMQADTWAELMQAIGSTLEMLFKDLCEADEFDQFLREHGWEADGQIDADAIIDMPFLPTMAQAHDPASAVR